LQDLLLFGGALVALILLLFGSLLIAARIYIHRFQKWMDQSAGELKAIRAELDSLKRTHSSPPNPPGPPPDSVAG
jgi:hypothetical protein